MIDIPWVALIGFAGVLAGAWANSGFTARRTKADRLWELRRTAYGELIYQVREIAKALRSEPQGDRERKFASEYEKLSVAYQNHLLLISAEFETVLFDGSGAVAMHTFFKGDPASQSALADRFGTIARRLTEQAKHELGLEERSLLPKPKVKDR